MYALIPSLEALAAPLLGVGIIYATYRIALWIERTFQTSVFYLPLLVAGLYLHQQL
jgi:hypothetical protein